MGNGAVFRPAPTAEPGLRPSGNQTIALVAALLLVAGAVTAASFFVRPDRAHSFQVFGGSLLLEDALAPVSIDLASGKPTVRLVDANTQVGAKKVDDLAISPLPEGALLFNRTTGQFNMVDSTGFVIKRDGGVPLPALTGATSATAVSSGELSYIEQHAATRTSVYVVDSATVQDAAVSPRVQPRAWRAMPVPISTSPESSAGADGSLWVLTGADAHSGVHIIRRLSIPSDSRPGATLDVQDYGTVSGTAAVGTAADQGGTVVGVATDHDIRLFQRGRLVATADFAAPAGVTSILPATNASGRLSFLMRGSRGWSVVSVAADGSGLNGPTVLSDIAPTAQLLQPVASNGALYTMDALGGGFVRIDSADHVSGIAGAGRYPLATQNGRVIEPGGFADAYAIGRGSRVIFDSPAHRDALVVFTDGSRPPLRIEKSAAVSLNAAGSVEALTRSRLGNSTGKGRKQGGAKPRQQASPVSNKIDCGTVTQKPHIPTITEATAGSRSVLLSWTYPLLDAQDCEPSTYQVQATTETSGAPHAPAPITVQGQTGVNLSGLNPSTRYDITVTAYIDGVGTPSLPVLITTGASGPDQPLDVQASAGGAWEVTWASCGTSRSGCVPASTWRVVPQFCDGLGLSAPPAPVDIAADPTTTVQPGARIDGGGALLGRGLSFQVEGIGADGTIGTPSASTPCTYSWGTPVGADITVTASSPPTTTANSTTTTNAVVHYASVASLGGVGATLTYRLLDASGNTVSTVGPTASTSAQLGGIRPGAQYRVQVTVIPPRHPEAALTLAPIAVQPTTAAWPAFTVAVRYSSVGLTGGHVVASFQFPVGTPTQGESFDLTNSSMTCGSAQFPLVRTNVFPGSPITFDFDRVQFSGACIVTLQLVQNPGTATTPPLFGATSSAPASSPPFAVATLPDATTVTDFSALWTGAPADATVSVNYTGTDPLATLSSNWTVTVSNASGDCGSANTLPPDTIEVSLACVRAGGPFTVSVDYTYLGTDHHFDGVPVTGTAPQPVDPADVSFQASWTGDDAADAAIDLHYTGTADPSTFNTFDWVETVTTSDGTLCGGQTLAAGTVDLQIPVDLSACPPTDSDGNPTSYTIEVTFNDPTYGVTGDYKPPSRVILRNDP